MSIAKEAQYKQETELHQHSGDIGAQALRAWLYRQRSEIDAKWPDARGEDLIRLQGEAKLAARLIGLIDHGPKIKSIGDGQ